MTAWESVARFSPAAFGVYTGRSIKRASGTPAETKRLGLRDNVVPRELSG